MKVVCLGDLQARSCKLYPETNKEGVNLRLCDTIEELDRIRVLCSQRSVEAVCILGDIFDTRNTIDVVVFNHIYRAFRRYVECGLRLILLVGNHDRADTGREHALEGFKSFCDVVDAPRRFDLRDGPIVAIPFHPNGEKVVQAIGQYVTEDVKLLLLHTAIQELVLPGGKRWGEGIPLMCLPPHVITIAGHFHRWREVREGNVFYVGSLQHEDRGDTGIVKYFGVYNSESHAVIWDTTQGPQFVRVEVPWMPEVDHPAGRYTQEEFVEAYAPRVRGNYVSVVSIPPDWTDNAAIVQALLALGARAVDMAFHTEMPMVPPQLLAQAETPAAVAVVEEYVEAAETALDKAQLLEQAVDVIEAVTGDDFQREELTIDVN